MVGPSGPCSGRLWPSRSEGGAVKGGARGRLAAFMGRREGNELHGRALGDLAARGFGFWPAESRKEASCAPGLEPAGGREPSLGGAGAYDERGTNLRADG